MALSSIFYARTDNGTAQNSALNVTNAPVTQLQFTSGTSGDLTLDFVADGADLGTIPEIDPDTRIIINGVTYNFAVLKSGTLPVASVPLALQGKTVIVIKVDTNNDGDVNDNSDTQLFFTLDPAGTPVNMGAIGTGALTLGSVSLTPPPTPVCFCTGTEIATPSGPRKVETLVAGDMVLNDRGEARQVFWIGRSRISLVDLRGNAGRAPIRIPAGAFGANLPYADLFVSPQHRIVLDGPAAELLIGEGRVLAAAKHLVGIFAETVVPADDVEYFHILTEAHEILLSNGLATESFQPASRTVDVMAPATRQTLEAALAALGRDAMLTRKDALPSLKAHETRSVATMMQLAAARVPEPLATMRA